MFEGKELEGKIGEVGSYSLDVTGKGEILAESKIDFIKFLEIQAKKTNTPMDDLAISWIKKVLGQ